MISNRDFVLYKKKKPWFYYIRTLTVYVSWQSYLLQSNNLQAVQVKWAYCRSTTKLCWDMKLVFPYKTKFLFFVLRRSLLLYFKAFGFDTSDVQLVEVYDIPCKFGFVQRNALFLTPLFISIDSNHAHCIWTQYSYIRTRVPCFLVVA